MSADYSTNLYGVPLLTGFFVVIDRVFGKQTFGLGGGEELVVAGDERDSQLVVGKFAIETKRGREVERVECFERMLRGKFRSFGNHCGVYGKQSNTMVGKVAVAEKSLPPYSFADPPQTVNNRDSGRYFDTADL